MNWGLKFTPDGLAAVRAESIVYELLVAPCGLRRLCLRSSAVLCHKSLTCCFWDGSRKMKRSSTGKSDCTRYSRKDTKRETEQMSWIYLRCEKVSQINSSFCKNLFPLHKIFLHQIIFFFCLVKQFRFLDEGIFYAF